MKLRAGTTALPRGIGRITMIVVCCVVATTGCVRRRLLVRTQPAGALVSVDNQVIGTSPAASTFNYYATREFRIEKPGYRTETIRKEIRPPWYQFPGLDFISETLWPGEIRDQRIIDVQLVPETPQPIEEVVGRADDLRLRSRGGTAAVP